MDYSTQVIQLAYQALLLILILSAPPILISMTFGLMVAIFQAATQIQEQTLSFTVKLFAVVMVLLLMGSFLGSQIMNFSSSILTNFWKWHSS